MRIIRGFLKGKKIKFIKNSNTRPLKDNVKENIFNILEHANLIDGGINKSNILDLYSGVGSFGIECISRGASKVTFVEKDNFALNILRKNLIDLSIKNKANLINQTTERAINKFLNEKFNIFFFDPPYANKDFINDLSLIKQKNFYKKNHIVVIHREKKTMDNFDSLINISHEKVYGRSKIIFGFFHQVKF